MAAAVVSDNFETSTGAIPNLGGADVTTRLCSAWVNFNGAGTVAIRDSYNISSITDNSVGNYTINFTTAMPDANYSVGLSATDNGTAGQTNGYAYGAWKRGTNDSVFATTSLRIGIGYPITTTYSDQSIVNVQIFGN